MEDDDRLAELRLVRDIEAARAARAASEAALAGHADSMDEREKRAAREVALAEGFAALAFEQSMRAQALIDFAQTQDQERP